MSEEASPSLLSLKPLGILFFLIAAEPVPECWKLEASPQTPCDPCGAFACRRALLDPACGVLYFGGYKSPLPMSVTLLGPLTPAARAALRNCAVA